MLKLDYVSARGDVLPLSESPYFVITHIDGQTSASADLSSSVVGNMDGDKVNNIRAVPRSIILDLRIRGGVEVEAAKREILRVVKIKQRGSLVWTQDGRTITISGIVEVAEMPRWTDSVTMQITLYCEQPFWEDLDAVVEQISEAISLHYFTTHPAGMLYFPVEGIPFGAYDTIRTKSFYNDGDVAVGMEITIRALGTVTNPIIYDSDGNYFGLGYEVTTPSAGGTASSIFANPLVLKSGDFVKISTVRGNKTVTLNGETNLFSKIKPGSKWLQMEAGDNAFTINSDDESISNMTFSLVFKRRYV